MKIIPLQVNPIVPARQVIGELERVLIRYGYNGVNVAVDTGLLHHQRIYEIPNEGAVCLNITNVPPAKGYASQVWFVGFNEDKSRILNELEVEVRSLARKYLSYDVDFIGQTILDAMGQ
jgi:hypothetical protein